MVAAHPKRRQNGRQDQLVSRNKDESDSTHGNSVADWDKICYTDLMRKSLLLPLTAVLALSASPAAAQVFVYGDGSAQLCFMAAKTGDMGSMSAIRTCTDALSETITRKDEAATYVNRGVLQMRKGDHDKAVADYEAALAIQDDLSEAYINYAAALFYTDRLDDALVATNKALALGTTKEAEALYNRALVYDRQGNLRAAFDDLTRALEIKPDWEPAVKALSRYEVRSRPRSS